MKRPRAWAVRLTSADGDGWSGDLLRAGKLAAKVRQRNGATVALWASPRLQAEGEAQAARLGNVTMGKTVIPATVGIWLARLADAAGERAGHGS